MASDASLVGGQFYQDHQIAPYQSLGQLNSIDLQYSSLQADDQPIVGGAFNLQTDWGMFTFTSMKFSLLVNSASQGNPVTINNFMQGNGVYLTNFLAANASGLSTGMYTEQLTVTFNRTMIASETFTNPLPLLLDNNSSSPYGSGWTIGGLQTIFGSPGSSVMITDGSGAPELFTTGDGKNYTGYVTDTSKLVYNSANQNPWTRTYSDGTVVTYNPSGQEVSLADRNNNTYTYAYGITGPAGSLSTITDPVGLITTLSYSSGRLSTIKDPAGRITTITMDSNGNLTKILDPDNALTTYGYSSSHQMTSEYNPDSHTASVAYDSNGRVTTETLFDGTLTVKTSAAQEQGLLPWGSSNLTSLATTMVYTGTAKNPDNAVTSVTFDSLGGVVSMTDANGGTTTIVNNANDWPQLVTDPMGRQTSYQYDVNGNITQITHRRQHRDDRLQRQLRHPHPDHRL